jgi:hypothetical protein
MVGEGTRRTDCRSAVSGSVNDLTLKGEAFKGD